MKDNYLQQLKSHADLFSLQGKTAAVIGGGGHVCSALANGFASAGANVAIIDIRLEKAEAVAKDIKEKFGVKTVGICADATKQNELVEMMKLLLNFSGKIDIAVNGGGINSPEPFLEIKETDWQKVVDSQLTATYLGCQVFGKHMLQNNSGSIINISSASAQRPLSRVVGYSASKAAIDNFTKWMAVELAGKYGQGIRVNAIAPGFFIGEQNRSLLLSPDGNLTPRGVKIIEHTPMGRFGIPEDLDGILLFLCSDMSKFVTGITVSVDGGFGASSI